MRARSSCSPASECLGSVSVGVDLLCCIMPVDFCLHFPRCPARLWTCLGFCFIHVLCPASVECIIINPQKWSPRSRPLGRSVRIAMVAWLICSSASAVPLGPCTEAERQRFQRRDGTQLFAMRAIKQQTRDRRKVYLTWFREWLWEERQISFRSLIDQKPPDPERLAELLVDYGKALYRAGKAYGIYAETINSVAVERPLIRRSLTTAWDLAFAWLQDEPHSHHPAMPLTVMAAMVVVALYWGWPYEAAVILMSWTGVMRIGEVLSAKRKDVVLPGDAAPGTSFLLIVIQQPKTRGRAAKHQAARIDQEDVIRFLSAMYQDFPSKQPSGHSRLLRSGKDSFSFFQLWNYPHRNGEVAVHLIWGQ